MSFLPHQVLVPKKITAQPHQVQEICIQCPTPGVTLEPPVAGRKCGSTSGWPAQLWRHISWVAAFPSVRSCLPVEWVKPSWQPRFLRSLLSELPGYSSARDWRWVLRCSVPGPTALHMFNWPEFGSNVAFGFLYWRVCLPGLSGWIPIQFCCLFSSSMIWLGKRILVTLLHAPQT